MLHKTRGIVFRFTRFGDTSIIVNIFTGLFGLQSYIVNGVRSASAKGKMALYQPLTLLDMVVYYRENASIKRIKEVKCLHPYHSIYSDVKKSAISLFLNELLNKAVKDESHSEGLYQFMESSFLHLDNQNTGYENFHLVFLIQLSRLLGFGAYSVDSITGSRMVGPAIESGLKELVAADYSTRIALTNDQRREALDLLLQFYQAHLDLLGEFKSVAVLKEVLS